MTRFRAMALPAAAAAPVLDRETTAPLLVAGGGGGGGYTGGGGGEGRDLFGGGGARSSYVASSAAEVMQTTSQLIQDGMVTLTRFGAFRDADSDGVPDAHDRCRNSDLTPTLKLGRCETRALNDLDVDGCTVADRAAKAVAGAKSREQLAKRVARLWRHLNERGYFTAAEKRAIRRCAAKAGLAGLYR